MSTESEELKESLGALLDDPQFQKAVDVLAHVDKNAEKIVDGMEAACEKGHDAIIAIINRVVEPEAQQPLKKKRSKIKDGFSKAGAEAKSIAQDSKNLFQKHVISVFKNTRQELKENKRRRIGAMLSCTGKVWDGIGDYWSELTSKHKVLDVVNSTAIKPLAFSLYSASLPVFGAIKAADFMGRTLSEHGKGNKIATSLAKAGKETALSIVNHFVRVTPVSKVTPAVKAFCNEIGVNDQYGKVLIEISQNPKHAAQIAKLSPELASKAADHIIALGVKRAGLDPESLANAVIPSLAKGLDKEKVEILTELVADPKNGFEKLGTNIQQMAMKKAADTLKEKVGTDAIDTAKKTFEVLSGGNPKIKGDDISNYLKESYPKTYKKNEKLIEKLSGQEMTLEDLRSITSTEDGKLQTVAAKATDHIISQMLDNALGTAPQKLSSKTKVGKPQANKPKSFAAKLKRKPNFRNFLRKSGQPAKPQPGI